jgi:hypothetical protein
MAWPDRADGYKTRPNERTERTALKENQPPVFPSLNSHELAPFQPEELVCYCFGFTREAIEQDFLRNGRSLVLEKIAAEKKAGSCDCAHKNPRGR